MSGAKRVLLLVGVYRADWDDERFHGHLTPVVAGCRDETVWDMETDEDTQVFWAGCKAAFDPDGTAYNWREVWITLDVPGLRAPFETAEIAAQIEDEES